MFLYNKKCIHPKYWLLAIILAVFWVFAHLPNAIQMPLARALGRLGLRRISKIWQVTEANIAACFPLLSVRDRDAMAKVSIEELGVSLLETFIVWFRDVDAFLRGRYTVEGDEHLQAALDQDRGIIMLASHFGSVDVNGALLSKMNLRERTMTGTYRETDEVVNQFLNRVRSKYCYKLVSAGDQRKVFKELKRKNIVWYAPDIEVFNKSSAFVDFMGVSASTTLAISRLAKATNALVVPFVHYRESDDFEYRVRIFPALSDFPTDDPAADMLKVNQAIECMIAPYPARYWWAIKRFKHRPEGQAPIY